VKRRNTGKDNKGLSELSISLSSGRLGHEQWRSGESGLGLKIAYTLVPNEEMHRFMKFIDGAPKTQVDQLTPPGNLKANWSRLSELKNKDVIGTKDDDSAKAVKHLSDAGSIKEVVAGFLKNVVKYDNTKSPFQKFEFLRNVRSEYYIPGNHFANGLPPADSFLSTAAGKWKNRTNTMYQLSGMKVLDGADPNLYPTRTWEQTSRFPGRFKAAVSTNVFNPLREQTLPNQAHLSHNRTVHIHMNRPLIERFSITTKDTGGGITEFKRKVEEVLLEILNSANATR
jgi:hypothetical protein